MVDPLNSRGGAHQAWQRPYALKDQERASVRFRACRLGLPPGMLHVRLVAVSCHTLPIEAWCLAAIVPARATVARVGIEMHASFAADEAWTHAASCAASRVRIDALPGERSNAPSFTLIESGGDRADRGSAGHALTLFDCGPTSGSVDTGVWETIAATCTRLRFAP